MSRNAETEAAIDQAVAKLQRFSAVSEKDARIAIEKLVELQEFPRRYILGLASDERDDQ